MEVYLPFKPEIKFELKNVIYIDVFTEVSPLVHPPSASGGARTPPFVNGLEENNMDDDDDEEEEIGASSESVEMKKKGGPLRMGRRKINIEYIDDKTRRHITFSKRKAGIMKKVISCQYFINFFCYNRVY